MATPPKSSKTEVTVLQKFEQIAEKLTQTRQVKVGDFTFTLVSLTAAQDTEAHEAANPYSRLAYLYALKLETLARSVIRLDEVDIPEVVDTGQHFRGVPQRKTRYLFLKEVLGTFPQEIIDILWREYGVLAMEVTKAVDVGPTGDEGPRRATDKELRALQETDVRELVEREVEERRDQEGAASEAVAEAAAPAVEEGAPDDKAPPAGAP